MIQLTQADYEKLALAQRRMDALRAMCGHVEDGSDETIAIFQDDATHEWCLRIGSVLKAKQRFYAPTFEGVIDAALADHYENLDR